MEKRRVLRFVAAASAVTGGVTLTGNVVSASHYQAITILMGNLF